MKRTTRRLKMSNEQKSLSREKKEATKNRAVRICPLLNPCLLFSSAEETEERTQEARWREKEKKKKRKRKQLFL